MSTVFARALADIGALSLHSPVRSPSRVKPDRRFSQKRRLAKVRIGSASQRAQWDAIAWSFGSDGLRANELPGPVRCTGDQPKYLQTGVNFSIFGIHSRSRMDEAIYSFQGIKSDVQPCMPLQYHVYELSFSIWPYTTSHKDSLRTTRPPCLSMAEQGPS